jgi:hypothetical protein
MKTLRLLFLFVLVLGTTAAFAQQPQTSDVSNTQPLFAVNAKYVNGVAPGYWATAGSGLTLNVSKGTANCAGTIATYAGSTLTMTDNTTNYVYLNTASSCVPATKTTAFTAADIPLATVVTASGAITVITDDRTGATTGTGGVTGGSVTCAQLPALSGGDVTSSAGSCILGLGNIPNGTTMPGDIVAANSAAPSSPAAAHDALYVDSTDLRFHDKNASGAIGTTVVADTGASNNFLTGITVAGVISKAQPAFSNLSGSATTGQLPTVTLRRTCAILIGADNASAALGNTDIAPQGRQCFVPYAATVVEIEVAGDAGTPNVVVAKNHAGSLTDLLSGALATASAGAIACSNTGGSTGLDGATTCSSTLQNTSLAAGDYIETHSATAGGTAKRMSIFVTYTVN